MYKMKMTLISFSEENVGFVQFYFFKYKFLKICKNVYEHEERIEAGMEGLRGFFFVLICHLATAYVWLTVGVIVELATLNC